jgi:hypothetical protein
MTDDSPLYHKTYTIRLMSYQRNGEWVPLALAWAPGQREEHGRPITEENGQAFRTRDAADAVAKRLAIKWIDAQVPSATD